MSTKIKENSIKKAQEYIERVKDEASNCKYRQMYHFMAPAGWINDPNGLSYYKGEYHLFYQHNPYSHEWASMHWGHAVSKDLVSWRHLPVALAPDESYDNDEKGGCFSGSAVEDDGSLVLMYTGTVNDGDKSVQTQCIAKSLDGVTFEKYENNPVIKNYPVEGSADFRDPKVFRDNDSWYVVIGSGKDENGKALFYKSGDLLNWDYVGVLAESNGKFGTIWECPDFFKLDDKYVLMFSPMGLENRKTVYLVGDMNYTTGKFTWEVSGEVDWGFDYYAPQSFEDNKGRRIAIGWQNSWPWMDWFKGFGPTSDYKYNGCMSIAREIKLTKNNKLSFIPVEEMKSLRDEFISYENIVVNENGYDLSEGNNIHFEIEAEVDLSKTTAKEFKFELRSLDEKKTIISFDLENKKLTFDRSASDGYNEGVRSCDIEIDKDRLDIRIFSDTSSIEVYTNDYKTVMTSNIYMVENDVQTMVISNSQDVYFSKLIKYNLEKK